MSFTASMQSIISENRNGLLGAHPTWRRVLLSDIADILNGFPFESKKFSEESGHPLIRIRDIVRGYTDTFYTGVVPEGYWVDAGEILVGMDGDFNVSRWKSSRALMNQRVLRLKSKNSELFDEGFLYHLMAGYLKAINEQTSSVTVKHLSSKTVLSIPLPLPAIAEQTLIALKLDEMDARVKNLKARIDYIPGLIKKFRQSVLAAAVCGRLTQEWRSENITELEPVVLNLNAVTLSDEELAAIRGDVENSLPSQWPIYALEQLVESERGIPYGIVQTGDPVENGVPTVRCGDVRPLYIEASALKLVSPEIEFDYQRTRLQGGEVLLAIRGSVGNAAVVPSTMRGCNISREVAMIPVIDCVSAEYLSYVLQSPQGQRLLLGKVRGVAQKGINLADVRRFPVSLPSHVEQKEIVRRVEKLFTFAALLEAKVTAAQFRIDRLSESILARAFNGELTADWRADNSDLIVGKNSPDALLKKIKTSYEITKSQPKPKVIGVNKMTSITKLTKNELNAWVLKSKKSSFAFDDLKNELDADYEQLKECLFDALSDENPVFKQGFNEKSGAIVFVKVAK